MTFSIKTFSALTTVKAEGKGTSRNSIGMQLCCFCGVLRKCAQRPSGGKVWLVWKILAPSRRPRRDWDDPGSLSIYSLQTLEHSSRPWSLFLRDWLDFSLYCAFSLSLNIKQNCPEHWLVQFNLRLFDIQVKWKEQKYLFPTLYVHTHLSLTLNLACSSTHIFIFLLLSYLKSWLSQILLEWIILYW